MLASEIVKEATGEYKADKSPAAVTLGRLGGLKGGKARAKKLSREQGKQIAKKAARVKWSR